MAEFANKKGSRMPGLKRQRGRRAWSARALIKYTLLQLPATALLIVLLLLAQRWLDFSSWVLWSVVAFWVVKDIILFPFVWRSYDPDFPANSHSMIGQLGVANNRLAPSGYVRVRSELWRAEVIHGSPPIEKGERVRVRGIHGLTLLVQAENEERTP
jgi:membrane protein implicated in regulation of membrane protease activity